MFYTSNEAELFFPPELVQEGISCWQNVWHNTCLPWLQISFVINCQNDESINRIMMTPRVEDLLELSNHPDIAVIEVNLVTPGSINKSGRWKLDILHSIWVKKNKYSVYGYMLDSDEFVSELPNDEAVISEYRLLWE